MIVRTLAWQSGPDWFNTVAHLLGGFMVTPGFAGLMALFAAIVAGKQVAQTRNQDRELERKKRDLDFKMHVDVELAKRFEWVVGGLTPDPDTGKQVLTSTQGAALLDAIRAAGSDGSHLSKLLSVYRDEMLVNGLQGVDLDAPPRQESQGG